eukprot:gene8909-10439_t
MTPAIHVDHLNKTFAKKSALVDLELTVATGEMVALIGASGSGKSTLLRHLAGLACCDKSNGGSVKVLGREVQASGRLNGKVRRLRADIGYIFQQFNLVNRLSVLDNVLLGCLGRMPRWRGNLGLFNTEEKHELSSQFLNDLYGADVDTSLMFSDQTRTPVVPARLALARA